MAQSSYAPSLARLKVHEGGYTNDPRDPGGPTNWGVTIYDVRKYIKPGATAADVKALSWDEAARVYKARYWNALVCDDLPAGVDDSVFDYGVNSGIGRAGKVLRRALGLSDAHWEITDEVLAALAKRDPKAIIAWIADERLRFLKSLKTWDHFGKGWGARVAEVKAFSLQLASGPAAIPTPDPTVQAAGKGQVPSPTVVEHAGKVATATTVAAGAGAWQWIAAHPAIVILAAIAAIAAVGALVSLLSRRHQAQQNAATPGLVPVPPAA